VSHIPQTRTAMDRTVEAMDEGEERRDWSPASSRPGEIYTVEGQIGSAGAFARGFSNRDPRARAYRRSAMQFALGWLIAGGLVMFVVAMLFVLL
jgi:hypothetical protein